MGRQIAMRWKIAYPCYLVMSLLTLCCVSDALLHRRPCYNNSRLFWGLVDNATHANVALISWSLAAFIAAPQFRLPTIEAVGALATGSLIDADHFLAAQALSLQAATSLQARPWGHSVTFVILLAILCGYMAPKSAKRKAMAFPMVCLLSHQLRDSFRRGLWFSPFGSTIPLPYPLYLILELILPLGFGIWLHERHLQEATNHGASSFIV
ncbi:hypothetical protein LEN26_019865 [Aphanomyces euteiches]|nr:hypothetical protein LEN26_019865 [Aphanomyces euteiches]